MATDEELDAASADEAEGAECSGHQQHAGAMVRDKQLMLTRLKKIEGQVRGLQRMIDEDRYCVDVLVQVAAVRAALNKVGMSLLEGHARGCMQAAVRRGEGDDAVAEMMDVLERFVK